MKKSIFGGCIILVLLSLSYYINSIKIQNKPTAIEDYKKNTNTIVLKENKQKLTAPKLFDCLPAQNYLSLGNSWKSR